MERDRALKLQADFNSTVPPGGKRRTDKWTHAFVGCRMRKNGISAGVASLMAQGKEILDAIEDFFTGDADSTPEDAAATMFGYWSAYIGATLKRRHIGCGIYTYYYIDVSPCQDVCDILYDVYRESTVISPETSDLLLRPTFVASVKSVVKENQEIIIKTAAKEVSKTDEEKANQISEDRIIKSEPTEECITVTEELRNVNSEIYEQRAKDLKENGEKGVRIVKFLLNKNKKEIHDLGKISPLCNLDLITDDHKFYVRNEKLAQRAMIQGYDGCKHCMMKFHIK